MSKRMIGVDVLIQDYFWSEKQRQYVYSFHCPSCKTKNTMAKLGIFRCECGSWLIVRDQP